MSPERVSASTTRLIAIGRGMADAGGGVFVAETFSVTSATTTATSCRFATSSAARLDAILDRINGWPETRRTTTYVVLTRYVGGGGG